MLHEEPDIHFETQDVLEEIISDLGTWVGNMTNTDTIRDAFFEMMQFIR